MRSNAIDRYLPFLKHINATFFRDHAREMSKADKISCSGIVQNELKRQNLFKLMLHTHAKVKEGANWDMCLDTIKRN